MSDITSPEPDGVEDVEGHVQPGPGQDAEGFRHIIQSEGAGEPEGLTGQAGDDEDDVEGHIKMRG